MGKQKKDIVEKLNKKIEENKKYIKDKEEKEQKNKIDETKKGEKSEIVDEKNIKEKNKKSKGIKNKTLKRVLEFVEAFVYIICIIVVIFANLYGPIYIQMIPLLFILGIVGKLVYDRPVITTVFGMLVAICAVYITGVKDISQNLIISAWAATYIALGEVCGLLVKKSYKYMKKKTKRTSIKAILSYFLLVVIFVVSLGIYDYTNSNYFELEKSRQRLNEYLAKNYDEKEFEIVDINYNFLGEKSFTFELKEKEEDRVYEFIVSKDEKFEISDGYIKFETANKEKNANEKLIKFLKDNKLNEKYKNVKVGVMLNEIDNFELEIIKEEETITEENTLEFSKQIALVINDVRDFEYFKDFEQIIISLRCKDDSSKNLTSYLYTERYLNNSDLDITKDYEYIKKALNVEYID